MIITFLRGDKKGFPCSNLSKPKLKQTLAKVLQSYNGQLPPVPREPTVLERQVVSEYKTEQKRIEQEQKAREAAEAEVRVDNADSGTDLPVIDLPPLPQMQQFVIPVLPPGPLFPPAPILTLAPVGDILPFATSTESLPM